MQTTATCKTTWTHKLEHKFAAKQLDSRINCMQRRTFETDKNIPFGDHGCLKCYPQCWAWPGHQKLQVCQTKGSSSVSPPDTPAMIYFLPPWMRICEIKFLNEKKRSSSCSCCYPSPDSLRTRKNITTTANEWTTERKRQRYLILDADDTIEDYGTMSSLHIVQAVHSSIQSDASYDRQPGQRPHRACRRKLHVAHVVEIHPSNFFSDPATKNSA